MGSVSYYYDPNVKPGLEWGKWRVALVSAFCLGLLALATCAALAH